MDDPNDDLIGYEFVNESAGGSRWRVLGTDPVLKSNYVALARVLGDGTLGTHRAYDRRVQTAAVIRRRRELEAAAA